ncbi:SDR family NAD(P)-dependent oxidoreductase [Micromonospora sp. AMSO12t]|uniref:SDR family NAD(P)-dependent oxidoreductase n=1 Tax=unclassified Micromonospora TaxID=2617518 RepID=UPI00124B2143|nr:MULTISPECIES: SDR family NAD(P)-dependent oxidoreductase [unclassified Micromonospora]KAB1162374.1 SDR family NAD(P)-dependent oxidoreductase [Micromonospora sp. AMSO12t]WSG01441.1 SDR family NAD(P)-dependent oxidoreductase [Micromonospora sp. NBC_01740]
MTETDYDSAVALIGMAGRFPGAADVGELWRKLRDGVPGLRPITDEELTRAGVAPARAADPDYIRVGGPVDDLDLFDAGAFGFSPREAETMEPQHRLFLECSWQALEAAGYQPVDPGARVGVFAGCAFPDYMIDNVAHMVDEPGEGLLFAVGNERDSLTSLVSYKLGLRGPSVTVQTFCSTSLVAVHLACQSLLTYDCDVALAGGAFLPLPQPAGYLYEQGGILSPDGRVRSFDAAANGSVMGSGVGVVALKRMTDALADGDVIHAVILGSAVNNDGPERVGYTAPGVEGQAEVIETALAVAGVKSETIGYVECHATGTPLGDSIELAAMSRVFQTTPPTPCVLSSVKPSVGHLDRAAGVTGLMRAALSLRHEILPAVAGYTTPNPTLAAAADRFTVLTEPRPWPAGPDPRRAGVSSFGLGGTNAHVVLEQAPARVPRAATGPQLLTFSAGDPTALEALTDRLRQHLVQHPEADLADVAYTLQVSRGRFALRRAVVCRDRDDAIAALADAGRWIDGETRRRDPAVLLRAGDGVPDAWWAELSAAVGPLLPADGAARGTDRNSVLADLGTGLARLGVVLTGEPADSASPVEVLVAPGDEVAAEWVLTTLAQLWLAGATVDWAALHLGAGRRVELPTYPFQRSRYWVKPRPAQATAARPVEGRVDDPAEWTYLPTWTPRPLDTADLDERLRAAGPWLVLTADERGEALLARLAEAGAEVCAARPGEAFEQDEAGDFTVRADAPDDLAELVRALFVAPRTIVHGFSLGSPEGTGGEHFERGQDRGFRSALALVRALADDPDTPPTELVLLTSGALGVLGADLRHPEHATLAALAPSLAQENPFLACRHVDVAGTVDVEQALAASVHPHQGPVAVRDGDAWSRHYRPHPLPAPTADRPIVSAGDTVLITGGLGDVGLVLARHLAERYGCRLVLTARTALPPREQWPARKDGDDRVARHIRNILDLERQGAAVLATAADVGDEARMREVVDAAVAKFGGIDVVVHAAGIQSPEYFGLAHLSDRASCDAHLNAKIHGFHVLQAVLGEHAPDRRITLSSVSAVLGGIALGPYSAANAGLDAYARVARLRGEGRWITVDWDTWAIDPSRPDGMTGQTVREYEMSPAEGVDVFGRALAAVGHVGHLVISTGPIEARIAQWVTNDPAAGGAEEVERERHPRPTLATPYVEPEAGVERTIADIWAATLGLETVGATDNFFELGGHSLIAISLATKLRSNVSAQLPVTALVEYPTVRQLAALVGQDQ